MHPEIKPLIVGNWKMNGLSDSLSVVQELSNHLENQPENPCAVVICPPATLIWPMRQIDKTNIAIGGQNCHAEASGAHTGDISAEMLFDAGARYVIVGHSERRADAGETSAHVREKVVAANRAKITPIVCVGETEQERLGGEALKVVTGQLFDSIPDSADGTPIIVAYEPVWAIGTGLVPSLEDIGEMHAAIRGELVKRFGDGGKNIAILYGGSMKPGNAAEILSVAHVNGGLVGGASLKADNFIAIIEASWKPNA